MQRITHAKKRRSKRSTKLKPNSKSKKIQSIEPHDVDQQVQDEKEYATENDHTALDDELAMILPAHTDSNKKESYDIRNKAIEETVWSLFLIFDK